MGSNLAQTSVYLLKHLKWCTGKAPAQRMGVGGMEKHLVQFNQGVVAHLHCLACCKVGIKQYCALSVKR